METPQIQDRRYIQLTPNFLLEYRYIKDRWTEASDGIPMSSDLLGVDSLSGEKTGSYTQVSISTFDGGIAFCDNKYDNQRYFMNPSIWSPYTENTILESAIPVNSQRSEWCSTDERDQYGRFYGSVDSKWTLKDHESDIITDNHSMNFGNSGTETVLYDLLRIYRQAGYVSDYDGFIFNLQVKDKYGNTINLASVINTKINSPIQEHLLSSPMFFMNKLYSSYIEIRIPSLKYFSSSQNASIPSDALNSNDGWKDSSGYYNPSSPIPDTFPGLLTLNKGFSNNPSLYFSVFGVIGNTKKNGFTIYKTQGLSSVIFPNCNTEDYFSLRLSESDIEESTQAVVGVDYIIAYPYISGSNERESMYRYLKNTGASFTMVHTLSITEYYIDNTGETESYVHAPAMFIQTQEDLDTMNMANIDPRIKYRPILKYAERDIKVSISYEMRLINDATNTSIIKTVSYDLNQPKLYGASLHNIKFNRTDNVKVYNRIEKADINPEMLGHGSIKLSSVVHTTTYNVTGLTEKKNIVVSLPLVKTNQ